MGFSAVHTGLEWFRTKFVMSIAEFIATKATVPVENIYYIILIIISLYIGSKIFFTFYTSLEKRWIIFLAIAGGIFAILHFV